MSVNTNKQCFVPMLQILPLEPICSIHHVNIPNLAVRVAVEGDMIRALDAVYYLDEIDEIDQS